MSQPSCRIAPPRVMVFFVIFRITSFVLKCNLNFLIVKNAGGENRTLMDKVRTILSRVRLPIPPPRPEKDNLYFMIKFFLCQYNSQI